MEKALSVFSQGRRSLKLADVSPADIDMSDEGKEGRTMVTN